MSNKQPAARRGLGRGLGSLIPTGPPVQPGARPDETDAAVLASDYVGSHAAPPATPATAGADVREQPAGSAPLLEKAPVEVAGAYFAELPAASITPNARQPRQAFEEEAMAELVHSIKEVGLLQPVVVRRTGESSYELIMGERRWRACREAGLETVPAIVRQTGDDDK